MTERASEILPDSERHGLVANLPATLRPYALLARFDRPIGWWLLYWPCVWGLLLADGLTAHWPLFFWFLIGAIAMRGAGCVYNDIADRDLDAKVARTRGRPLASGAVTVTSAWVWLAVLALIGLIVLLQLDRPAQIVALASLAPVAAYPFMKRITWWPQAWLGIVFSWGALVGWVAVTGGAGGAGATLALLYAGCICWVIGFDTIYALQDREDDALIGVRSTARLFGNRVRSAVAGFYAAAILLWLAAFWILRPQPMVALPLLPMAVHLARQVATLKIDDGGDALDKFRSNRFAGLLMAFACLVVGATS